MNDLNYNKNLNVLRLDSYVSYISYKLVIISKKYNIIIYMFPLYLTHTLQT